MTPTRPPPKTAPHTPQQVVRSRLRALSRVLKPLADGRLPAKELHELRIACRRAEAALSLCDCSERIASAKWLRRHLSDLRRTGNVIRDNDVLRKWLKPWKDEPFGQRLWKQLTTSRRDALARFFEHVESLTAERGLPRRTQLLVKRLTESDQTKRAHLTFGKQLFHDVEQFVLAFPERPVEAVVLHQLRIDSKRLRYSIEVVSEIWPEADLSELTEVLKSLQQRLGELHDEFVRQAQLEKLTAHWKRRWRNELPPDFGRRQKQNQKEVWSWWQTLPLERILADATAEIVTLIRK